MLSLLELLTEPRKSFSLYFNAFLFRWKVAEDMDWMELGVSDPREPQAFLPVSEVNTGLWLVNTVNTLFSLVRGHRVSCWSPGTSSPPGASWSPTPTWRAPWCRASPATWRCVTSSFTSSPGGRTWSTARRASSAPTGGRLRSPGHPWVWPTFRKSHIC